jgi:hypothetical protein
MVNGSFNDEKEKKCKLPPQAHPIRQAFAGDDVEAKPVLGMRNWKLKMKRILKLKNLQLFFVGPVDWISFLDGERT